MFKGNDGINIENSIAFKGGRSRIRIRNIKGPVKIIRGFIKSINKHNN